MFEQKMRDWLNKYGFTCDVQFADEFGYDIVNDVLYIGINGYPTIGRWFEQFLYEYGLEYTGIYDPVLCICHELGHSETIFNFTDEQLNLFYFLKSMTEEQRMDCAIEMFKYWEVPDEFVANCWAIDFINENIDAVSELCDIYYYHWNEFIEERKCA